MQLTLQESVPHSTPRHEPLGPVQLTLHGPSPQTTLRQAREPVHWMSQASPAWQLTPERQASVVLQRITQFHFSGQVTGWLQLAPAAQSIVHSFLDGLHEMH